MDQPITLRFVRGPGGWLAGVCEGLGRSLDIPPWILRALFVFSVGWLGTGVMLYLFAAISFPRVESVPTAYDRKFLGVCSKIAAKYDFEVGLVRFLTCFLAVTTGMALIVYFVLAVVMPKNEPQKGFRSHSMKEGSPRFQ